MLDHVPYINYDCKGIYLYIAHHMKAYFLSVSQKSASSSGWTDMQIHKHTVLDKPIP